MTDHEKRPDPTLRAASFTSIALAGLGPAQTHFKAEGRRQERVMLIADLTGMSRMQAETVYNDLCGTVQQKVCRERNTRAPLALDQAWIILRGVILNNGDIPTALALVDAWLALPDEDLRPSGSTVVAGWVMKHSKGSLTAEELRRLAD